MRIARALGSLPGLRWHLAHKITTRSGAIERKVSTAMKDPGHADSANLVPNGLII
jgi:hypothetical protein